jgi:hypothetical protein
MTDLLLTCGRCDADVNIRVELAVLRVNAIPDAKGELLFRCPGCNLPEVQPLGARVLALLLQAGVPPIALGEPTLDPSDKPPAGPKFTWEDLLNWHQQLQSTVSVDPWT